MPKNSDVHAYYNQNAISVFFDTQIALMPQLQVFDYFWCFEEQLLLLFIASE